MGRRVARTNRAARKGGVKDTASFTKPGEFAATAHRPQPSIRKEYMSAAAETTIETSSTMPASTVRVGMDTPWGRAQSAQNIIRGVGWVSTAGHGGYRLCSGRNRQVPEYMRREDGWYEEDCDWAIVAVVFEELLLASNDADIKRIIRSGAHKETLRDWHPKAYEQFYGVPLRPGESYLNDERLFFEEHANDLLVISASGDWHGSVPEGMVGVVARVGGRGAARKPEAAGPDRYFLVPKDEYDKRNRFGFVVDPARHQEIEQA